MKMKIILIGKALGFLSSTSEAAKIQRDIYFNTDSQDTQKKVDTLGTYIERKRKEAREDKGLKCFFLILLGGCSVLFIANQ